MEKELIEELRNIAWWTPGMTLSALVNEGLKTVLETHRSKAVTLANPLTGKIIAKKEGEPFPSREGALPVGRPMT